MGAVNIREAALGGDPQTLEAGIAASLKACESAIAALEALHVSLMVAASMLPREEAPRAVDGVCQHLDTFQIQTMGRSARMCNDCGDQLADAIGDE